jgi:acyl-CoA synthetase (NDP forming)
VIHKTDVGGIVTGINNLEEARKAFLTITRNVKEKMPKVKVKGVLIQRMLKGFEAMVGCKTDPQFGRVMLFGTGGLYAEVYKDVTARVLPLSKKDVEELIKETKCYEVLSGFRGKKYNLKDLKNIIFRFQKLVEEEEIVEADLNPIMVSEKYAKVVDARMIKLKLKKSD